MPAQVDDTIEPQDGNTDPATTKRFDIVSALAKPFEGLIGGRESKLHIACRAGDIKWIENILGGCAAFYPKDDEGQEVKISVPITKELINERNRLGATPLWLASVMGYYKAIKILVKHGADLEIEDIKGQTPLHAATKFNHIESVKVLLECGANPDGSETNISTPIYVAARDNYPLVMELLIKHGANVNGRHGRRSSVIATSDYYGNLPVYMTLVYQHFECFRQLLIGGADLTLPPNLNGGGASTSVLCGILRYACDIRYLIFLVLCGGIPKRAEVDEVLGIYSNRSRVANREECKTFLIGWKANPMSLCEVSRIVIRQCMGQKRLQNINQLTLPKRMKDYIAMRLLDI